MKWSRKILFPHERRSTFTGFIRQLHKYGQGRGQMIGLGPPIPCKTTLLIGSTWIAFLILWEFPNLLLGLFLTIEALGWTWMVSRRTPLLQATLATALWTPALLAYNLGIAKGLFETTCTRERFLQRLRLPRETRTISSALK